MTYQPPPEPGPGRSTLGNVIFFIAVVAIIVGFAAVGFLGEQTASNAPVETTVGQAGRLLS
jgi:hypothetical protein